MTNFITRAEVQEIVRQETLSQDQVRQAAHEAAHEVLLALGIDTKSALDTQADMAYVRKLRQGSDALKSKLVFGVVGAIATALIAMVVAGFYSVVGNINSPN